MKLFYKKKGPTSSSLIPGDQRLVSKRVKSEKDSDIGIYIKPIKLQLLDNFYQLGNPV